MLSQTVEYALRAMASLAYTPDELVPTPELAQTTKVPANYLAKVLQTLASADLIVGRRGVGGGYKLARPAAEINLLDVINAVSPVTRIKECPLGLENHGPNLCPLHRRIDQAAAAVIELFGNAALSEMVEGEGTPQLPLCDAKRTQQVKVSVKRT
jgi:Rrf2 family nitric oxide-sensitive transcriptional repressor